MKPAERSDRARGSAPIGRRRRRIQGERGVTVVEAAFVTPVFFLLIFGVVEFGLTMNDYLALTNTVRAGSRVASAAGNDLYADYGIIQAVKRESSALPRSSITRIVVYRAGGLGQPPTASCQGGVPSPGTGSNAAGACNVYTAAAFTKTKDQWGCLATESLDRTWCPLSRKVSLTGPGPDYVGVWMTIDHQAITKLFVSAQTLTDQSVIRLEPARAS